ncbi:MULTISPECIES: ABC transporter ATP-binding protein [Rhodococcus]|uniref:ABC transporter ATP-binding protein n=1 Tax=Rhodococcus globerulus TaxID=33008 RepID=UPI001C59282A|nr:ABC transporter ATP-binding protein [Rhodococcus globerulus]QXW04971.1 ABC transporter ATP-binding protein [Rhodococcus globerulus]
MNTTDRERPIESDAPLLEVRGLTIDAPSAGGTTRLVDGVDLAVSAGERVALVGESGSGKSVTARALMRLDPNLTISGSVRLGGTEILDRTEKELNEIRGSRIGMVFQDPMSALDPLQTIGAQVSEPLRLRGVRKKDALRRAAAVLDELGVAQATTRLRAYPHEFSGGMRQRVVLAMALVGEPNLLIADEPTTALDVRVQQQVLRLLDRVTTERGLGLLLITHDLGVVAGIADRVAVMYSGRVVEVRDVTPMFASPEHPYSRGLLAAVPRLDVRRRVMTTIAGTPPSLSARPAGCTFHPRCPVALPQCADDAPETTAIPGGTVDCHLSAQRVSVR